MSQEVLKKFYRNFGEHFSIIFHIFCDFYGPDFCAFRKGKIRLKTCFYFALNMTKICARKPKYAKYYAVTI